jgi:hypothetical protein
MVLRGINKCAADQETRRSAVWVFSRMTANQGNQFPPPKKKNRKFIISNRLTPLPIAESDHREL